MHVKVTHLKAPWPQGVGVGSVVQVHGELPAWARGKCEAMDPDPDEAGNFPSIGAAPEAAKADAPKKAAKG